MMIDGKLYRISLCEKCDLKGMNYAFGRISRSDGNRVMFIGEAPGREEAKTHISFVGRSGKELDRWISFMGLRNYYITNVVKHRPTNDDKDRPPTKEEINACFPFLEEEIENYKPNYIIALGNPSSHALGIDMPITKSIPYYMENEKYYRDTKIRMLTLFHPSYALRRQNEPDSEYFNKILKDYLASIRSIVNRNS